MTNEFGNWDIPLYMNVFMHMRWDYPNKYYGMLDIWGAFYAKEEYIRTFWVRIINRWFMELLIFTMFMF